MDINTIHRELGTEGVKFASLHGFALGYRPVLCEAYPNQRFYTLICLHCQLIGEAIEPSKLQEGFRSVDIDQLALWEESMREIWSEQCPHLDVFMSNHVADRPLRRAAALERAKRYFQPLPRP